jgi:cysteine synthase A
MVELRRMTEGLAGRVAAKLEMRNPCGSVKDRLADSLHHAVNRGCVTQPLRSVTSSSS